MSKKDLKNTTALSSPQPLVHKLKKPAEPPEAEKEIVSEFKAASEVLPATPIPDQELPVKSRTTQTRSHTAPVSSSQSLQMIGDVFFDILEKSYGPIVSDIDCDLNRRKSDGAYFMELCVHKWLSRQRSLSTDMRAAVRSSAREMISDILSDMIDASAETDCEVDLDDNVIYAPTKIDILDLMKAFATIKGIKIYNPHKLNISPPDELDDEQRSAWMKDLVKKKNRIIEEFDVAGAGGEQVLFFSMSQSYTSREAYRAYAQMALESIDANDLDYSFRFAQIERQIELEDKTSKYDLSELAGNTVRATFH